MSEHTRTNRRLAKRLGIELPDPGSYAPSAWTTDGHDTVYDGHGKSERRIERDPRSETWTVSIGRRKYAEGVTLPVAMEVSHFLSKAQNRRAWKGLAPKERKAVTDSAEGTVTAKQALAEVLRKANGGAVRVS